MMSLFRRGRRPGEPAARAPSLRAEPRLRALEPRLLFDAAGLATAAAATKHADPSAAAHQTNVDTGLLKALVVTAGQAGSATLSVSGLPTESATDRQTVTPFAGVTLNDGLAPQTEQVTVQAVAASVGSYGNLGGFVAQSDGSLVFTGTAAAAQAALQGLSFQPKAGSVIPGQSEALALSFVVNDGASAVEAASHLTVTSANAITDQQSATPFAGYAIDDPGSGQSVTVTVSLDNAAKGSLGGGFTASADGSVYSFTGTAAAAQAALDALVFTPTAHRTSVGVSETTQFTVTVSDSGQTTRDSSIDVVTTDAYNPPTISSLSGADVEGGQSITPFGANSVTAPDLGQTVTVTVASSDTSHGSLSGTGFTTNADGSLSFTGTAAAANSALASVVYAANSAALRDGQNAAVSLTLTVTDGTSTSSSALPLTLISPNAGSDNSAFTPFLGESLNDPGSGKSVTVTVTPSAAANGSFVPGAFKINADGSASFSGSEAAAETALQSLLYIPTAHEVAPGATVTTNFTLQVKDGGSTTSDSSTAVVVTAANTVPSIGNDDPFPVITAGSVATPFKSVTITDPDLGQTEVLTVTALNPSVGSIKSFTGFTQNADGSLTISGTAAAVQAALQGLTYTMNPLAAGASATASFGLSLSDGMASLSQTITVIGNSAAPTITDQQSVTPFAQYTLTDESGGTTETVTVSLDNAAKGSFTGLNGFTLNSDGSSVSFTGTNAAAQAAIRGLVFTPTSGRIAAGTAEETVFTVVTAGTDNVTTDHSVSLTAAGDDVLPAGSSATPFASYSLNDPGPGTSETVTISLDNTAKGSFSNLNGFTLNSDGSLSFTGSNAAAQAAIAGLVFTPTPGRLSGNSVETTTFTVTLSDSGQVTTDSSISVTAAGPDTITDAQSTMPFTGHTLTNPGIGTTETVTVALDNVAKGSFTDLNGFTLNSDGSVSFTGTNVQAQAALQGLVFTPTSGRVATGSAETTNFTVTVVSIDPVLTDSSIDVTVAAGTDIPSGQSATPFANYTISQPGDGTAETVTVAPDDASKGSFTTLNGFTLNSDGSISFTGTNSDAQTALQGVVFTPTAGLATGTGEVTTTFTVTATDNAGSGNVTNDSSVTVTEVGPGAITETETATPFSTYTTTNPGAGTTETVTVSLNTPGNGSFTTLNGFTLDSDGSSVSFTGTNAQAQAAIQGLVFTPTAGLATVGNEVTTQFTVTTSDGGTSAVETPASVTTVGPGTINDPPNDMPFSATTLTDPSSGTTETVTVALDEPGNGSFTTLNGFSLNSDGSLSFTGTNAAAQAAIRGVVFTPTTGLGTDGIPVTSHFTVTVTGIGAVSAPDRSVEVDVVPRDAINDQQTATPFGNFTLKDPGNGVSETVTVALDDPSKGSFTTLNGFTLNSDGSSVSFTGSNAAAQAAINGLVFTPTRGHVAPGTSETTNFTVTVTDQGLTSTNTSVHVVTEDLYTPPAIVDQQFVPAITDQDRVLPFPGIAILDSNDSTITVTVTPSNTGSGILSSPAAGFVANADGSLTWTGLAKNAEFILGSVQFRPTPHAGTPGAAAATGFTITVTDGAVSATETAPQVQITPVDNSPVITGAVSGQTTAEGQTVTPFASMLISDPNPGQTETVTVTPDSTVKGRFSYAPGTFSINADGSVSFSGTTAAAEAALESLAFTPATGRVNYGQSETTKFTVSVSDGIVTSTLGGSSVQSFASSATPSIGTVADQSVYAQRLLNVDLSTLFTTPTGDSLTTNVLQADGSALPSWLSYNPATLTLSGSSPTNTAQTLSLVALAEDARGNAVATEFGITILAIPVSNRLANEVDTGTEQIESAESPEITTAAAVTAGRLYQAAETGFGDQIDRSTQLASGIADLPGARTASYDAATSAGNAQLGTLRWHAGSTGSYTLPVDDLGRSLILSATQADGTPLPNWLSFDPVSGRFSGTPPVGVEGVLHLKIVMSKTNGENATLSIDIKIDAPRQAMRATPGIGAKIASAEPAQEAAALFDTLRKMVRLRA